MEIERNREKRGEESNKLTRTRDVRLSTSVASSNGSSQPATASSPGAIFPSSASSLFSSASLASTRYPRVRFPFDPCVRTLKIVSRRCRHLRRRLRLRLRCRRRRHRRRRRRRIFSCCNAAGRDVTTRLDGNSTFCHFDFHYKILFGLGLARKNGLRRRIERNGDGDTFFDKRPDDADVVDASVGFFGRCWPLSERGHRLKVADVLLLA